jgi:hypothetical protein
VSEKLTCASSWRGEIGVDAEARTIRGMVLAEAGPLQSGRGEFDEAGLDRLAELINAAGGVESYYGHDHVWETNQPAIFLGMVKNAKVDRSPKPARVRADLEFAPSSSNIPGRGDLAGYVMQRTTERPEAISSSLVFYADLESRPPLKRGSKTYDQPPFLRPVEVLSSDIVGQGDAVRRLLSVPVEVEDSTPVPVPPIAHPADFRHIK